MLCDPMDDRKYIVTMEGVVDDVSLSEEIKNLGINMNLEHPSIIFEETEIKLSSFKGKPGHLSLILESLRKRGLLHPLNELVVS